jgi:NarL family two-component system response regulator LiaR
MIVRPPLRVAVISPYRLIRVGAVGLLSAAPHRINVVETVASQDQPGPVDVVLYDLAGLSKVGNTEVLHWLESATVVGLARDGRDDHLRLARLLGIDVVVPEHVEAAELVASVERAAGRLPGPTALKDGKTLTERELEVIRLVATGLSNSDIAAQLFLSINSVKTYIRTAYRKMGVTRRADAVLWSINHGLTIASDDEADRSA